MEVEVLQHLLILCCYGGVPYIDYQQLGNSKNNNFKHESTMSLDPTDWIAIDSSGSLLNNTIHPEILSKNPLLSLLIPPNTSLDQCDLYNLTFSSADDEHLYELGHGKLSCRCPLSRTGVACQSHLNLPQALALSSSNSNMGSSDPFASYMLASIFLMVAMILLFFSMMKGCFCDCFGGFQNPFKRNTDEPIDPVAISRCLHAVNEYEEKQKLGYPDQVNRPLITSVSENFAAPYNDTVYSTSQYPSAPPPPPPRNASPPPSYRSQNGSMEYLTGVAAKTQL